jgi:hypothetical protein
MRGSCFRDGSEDSGHLRHEIGETVGHPLSGRQQFGNRVESRFRWLRLSGGRFSLDGWYGVGVGDEETARSPRSCHRGPIPKFHTW